MNPTISVVDLASGIVSVRPNDTRTLDIPAGFDRRTPVASLDSESRVQCASTAVSEKAVEEADPENWALRQIFAASMLRIAWEDELRRRYPIERDRAVHAPRP